MSNCRNKNKINKDKHKTCSSSIIPTFNLQPRSVYGEFIRTFTFSLVELPIVEAGKNIPFPIATVPPSGVFYDATRVGLVVPSGVYEVNYTLNPSADGAIVDLLVNGVKPTTVTAPHFTYAESVINSHPLHVSYLVNAPNSSNLISLNNGGTTLFGLSDIPNTKVGNTSIITHIRVERL